MATRWERCRQLLEPQQQVDDPPASPADQVALPGDNTTAVPCPRCGGSLVRYPLTLLVFSLPVGEVAIIDSS